MAYTNEYSLCTCEKATGVYVEQDAWGYWECCCACGKRIEDSYTFFSDDYLRELLERDD